MDSVGKLKIVVTGVTGYIGGSVLARILADFGTEKFEYLAPVRDDAQMEKLRAIGVTPIKFAGLDDLENCREIASKADVVISCASASHDKSAVAWVDGLHDREQATGKKTLYLHTSGTSILSDRPVSGTANPTKVWSDIKDDIYEMEKTHPEPYGQRITDVAVVDAAEKHATTAVIVVPCTIYGRGSGPFKKLSQQIPNLIRLAKTLGAAATVGDGSGVWNHVHMDDLTTVYSSILRKHVDSSLDIPTGKKGIYMAVGGEASWKQVAEGISKAMQNSGDIKDTSIHALSFEELQKAKPNANVKGMELGLGSNSRAVPDLSEKYLAWKQKYTTEDFLNHFKDEVAWMGDELKAM